MNRHRHLEVSPAAKEFNAMSNSVLIACCYCDRDYPSISYSISDSGSISESEESTSEVSILFECTQCIDTIRSKNWQLSFSGGGTSPCASSYNGTFDLFQVTGEATRSEELGLFTAPTGNPDVCTTLSSFYGGSIKRFTLTCVSDLGEAESYWSLAVRTGFRSGFATSQTITTYTNLTGGATGYLNEIDCLAPITLYRDTSSPATVNEINMPETCVISPL